MRECGAFGPSSGGSASPESVSGRLVYPSEIHTLPDLTGYLKFAGDMPLAKVRIRYEARPIVVEPLILVVGKWSTSICVQPAKPTLFGGRHAFV